jgi:hypothetical protein
MRLRTDRVAGTCGGESGPRLRAMRYPLLGLAALVLLTACHDEPRPSASAFDFQVLRSYGWSTTVADPQATWNPQDYQVLARSAGGFVLLEEGGGKQQYFASKTRHETAYPVWVAHRQFAFGPMQNVITTTDGRLVPTSEGLTVVTLLETISGKEMPLKPQNLTNQGYRPRVWNDRLVAATEDKIIEVDPFGKITEFGTGFLPEPQRRGPGICWQERPVLEIDHWTGTEGRRGRLFIRWKPGVTTELANAVEARWTPDGGVIATVMRAEPVAGQPWYSGGTDLYLVTGPKAVPTLVAADARSADPHPLQPLCAAVGKSGALILCGYDGNFRRQLADQGDHPAWSHDGLRLMTEEDEGKHGSRYLHVYVFAIKPPAAVAPPAAAAP